MLLSQHYRLVRIGLSVSTILLVTPVHARTEAQTEEVANDRGGYVVDYAARLDNFRAQGRKVAFAGQCASACTLLLALPNRQVCIHPGAYFGFHAPSGPNSAAAEAVGAYMVKKYPNWVRTWLADQGGLSAQLKIMDYSYARQFIGACR
jgi:hypothetical protein